VILDGVDFCAMKKFVKMTATFKVNATTELAFVTMDGQEKLVQ